MGMEERPGTGFEERPVIGIGMGPRYGYGMGYGVRRPVHRWAGIIDAVVVLALSLVIVLATTGVL
jgi:hypothetical protein